MTDLTTDATNQVLSAYSSAYGTFGEQMAPGSGWSARGGPQSSDAQVFRVQNNAMADARDLSRANPYGQSARRTVTDAVIGARLTLQLEPSVEVLGVTAEAAADWVDMVEAEWDVYANSDKYHCDAQRKQDFTGLMRTAFSSDYVSGEALGTIEWKRGSSQDRTCLYLIQPERLSDPRGMLDYTGKRRMGIELDQHGAPVAYHIRERHPGDGMWWGPNSYNWKRVPRYTYWGRQQVLHHFEADQPEMTRGLSAFINAAQPMRMLRDYNMTELESAAVRATYAAVIESELDYAEAMKIIGPDLAGAIGGNSGINLQMKIMADRASYYRGQEFKFGKSKVAHLLPNENLKMVQGTQHAAALKDFNEVNLFEISAGLGVGNSSLTKNFSNTNYSGARAELYDVYRSYEVRRESFLAAFAMPLFGAWLEERIALRGTLPMLGNKNFYEVRDALVKGSFNTWGKPRLDPLKENQADKITYDAGALSLRDICAAEGRDWRLVMRQRAREKAEMDTLGLKPEDINWTLILNEGAKKAPTDNGGNNT